MEQNRRDAANGGFVDNVQTVDAPNLHDLSADLSTREAAAALDVNEQTIRRAIQRGELAATRLGRSFRITPAALDDYRIQRGLPPRLRLVGPLAAPAVVASPIPLFAEDAAAPTTLPTPLTPFFGRRRELALLQALLGQRDVRLVTLTGPGGIGKTRLALQAARDFAAGFADGAVFVALAPLRDAALLPTTLAHALGLRDSDGAPGERLLATLRDRHLLLILDNVEQLAGDVATSFLVDLLASCPGVTALVTSRTRLQVSGEHTVVVPPLALPERDGDAPALPAEAITQVESIQLFVDRARAARPGFALTADNAATITAICQRVDGLPLAIELAAARSAVLSPAALLARLDHRLTLLTGGPQDQPSRLRTMRDAIAWSYDLLEPATQAHFRRLAVFSGGFPVDGAEAVAGLEPEGAPAPAGSPAVLDSLETLVCGSLLQRLEQPHGECRFSLLETVREFALEQLDAAGELDAARAAHAAFCLSFVEVEEGARWGASSEERLDRIDREHDNIRAALTWTLVADPEAALRLAAGMGAFWNKRCHWAEGLTWLERALATGAGEETETRALALGSAGAMTSDLGDDEASRRYLRECLALGERLGHAQISARALRGLGIRASDRSEFAEAESLFARALAHFRSLDDRVGIARCLNDLGLVAERQGDHARAIALQEEALPIARAVGDDWQVCIILGNLGEAYYDRGDTAHGETFTQEALELARRIGDTFGVAVNLHNLGNGLLQRGDVAGAIDCYQEALALSQELGERQLASRTLDWLAAALHQSGASRPAVRLHGAAAALREATGDSLFAEEGSALAARLEEARGVLGDATFDASWAAGRTLPFAQAVAEGVEAARAALILARASTAPAISGLTRREQDVLRLVADGRSDREIADALFVTRRSASKYVSVILSKLGVPSRTAAAALVHRGTQA